MAQPHQPLLLKPLAPLQQEGAVLKLIGKVSKQRWLTVGAIMLLGGAGLLLADSAAEVLVGRLQQDDTDEDVG